MGERMGERMGETKAETLARWAREDAAAVTRREKNIVAKKRRRETKPADTSIEWRVVSRHRGREVYYVGGTCGVLWTGSRGITWGERDAKRVARMRRENLQNFAIGTAVGSPEQVEIVGNGGTRIVLVTGVEAREMFDNMRLERTEVNGWNLSRDEWGVLDEWD